MATVRGTPVIFSFTTAAGVTITGLTGWLAQSIDMELTADAYKVKDGRGKTVTEIMEDFMTKSTLNFQMSGTDRATAITNAALPALNTFVVITACAEFPELVSAYWIVDAAKKKSGNTTTMDADLTIHLNPNITT